MTQVILHYAHTFEICTFHFFSLYTRGMQRILGECVQWAFQYFAHFRAYLEHYGMLVCGSVDRYGHNMEKFRIQTPSYVRVAIEKQPQCLKMCSHIHIPSNPPNPPNIRSWQLRWSTREVLSGLHNDAFLCHTCACGCHASAVQIRTTTTNTHA